MSEYQFTKDWFFWAPPIWEQIVPQMKNRKRFLEIGSYEGRSTTWLIENAVASGGNITCIDTWLGGEEHTAGEMVAAEGRFKSNLKLALGKRNGEVTATIRKTNSFQGLIECYLLGETFDFIYIDGSHIAKDVMTDACLAFKLLNVDGVMVFDDYEWAADGPETHKPKMAVDAFLQMFSEQIYVINKQYQVSIQRMI